MTLFVSLGLYFWIMKKDNEEQNHLNNPQVYHTKQLVEILKQFATYNWGDFSYPNGDKVQPIDICYACKISKKSIDLEYQDEETKALAWVNLKTDNKPLFNPKMQQAINDYLKMEV